ncbi:MAG: hypothetical protein ABI347_02625 [Nitrososphaera sp.]|jgi:hypothetical protein
MLTEELLSRLMAAGVIYKKGGEPLFTPDFRLHIIRRFAHTRMTTLDIYVLRQLLCDFEPSLGSLTIDEIATLVTLFLFNVQSSPDEILADIRSSGLADV